MLPKNPQILLSVINTKLRDCYHSLDELCNDLDESKQDIIEILKSILENLLTNRELKVFWTFFGELWKIIDIFASVIL